MLVVTRLNTFMLLLLCFFVLLTHVLILISSGFISGENCTILIHEATMEDDLEKDAASKRHRFVCLLLVLKVCILDVVHTTHV